jgi:hypothetical protein
MSLPYAYMAVGRGSASTSPWRSLRTPLRPVIAVRKPGWGPVMWEIIAALVSVVVTSLLAWLIGTRVSYGWDEVKGSASFDYDWTMGQAEHRSWVVVSLYLGPRSGDIGVTRREASPSASPFA